MDIFSDFFLIEVTGLANLSVLLMRWILAFIFFTSFKNKYKDVVGFAKQNGLALPAAYMSIYTELAGAISLSLGFLTQLGGLAIMIIMTGSMYFHISKWKSPFWASKGGWEYDLMIWIMAFVIFTTGGGEYALYPLPALGWLPFLN